MHRGGLLAFSIVLLSLTSAAAAQEIPRAVRERCVRSIVRVEVETPAGMLAGSGTMIDPRGYVLTNFHVVGQIDHRSGLPGAQHARRFRVAITTGESEPVTDRYLAEVVRGHVQLDLAILRIVERIDGAPLDAPFPTMSIASAAPELGTQVWALGFPAGVRTVNITAGQVAGFELNAERQTAWLRTDTEFNPGNSGGALIDRECRLVGVPTAVSRNVEPIELARPAVRIPTEWREALARGTALEPQARPEGIPMLSALTELSDTRMGDGTTSGAEVHYYAVPRERPGVITVSPRLELRAIGPGGRELRGASGQMLVTASDPPGTLVMIALPPTRTGSWPRLRLRYTPMSARAATATGSTSVRGRITRTAGGVCPVHALLAPQGVDVAELVAQLAVGSIGEPELRARTRAVVSVDGEGRFELSTDPGTYTLALLPYRGVEQQRTVVVGADGLDVGALALETPCP